MAESGTPFIRLARARWKQADDAEKNQLQRELDDLRFYADDQWPDDIKTSRKGQAGGDGNPVIPARPHLVINKLRDPIRHVEAEAQQTDLGPEIVPADDFAGLVGPIDDTEIELREGLVRRIQRESGARDARNWAAQRARIAGRGYYVVMTRYASTRSMDQEVFVDRLYNQSTVKIDPRHEQPDGSDSDWGFYGTMLPWEQYKAEHPNRPSKPKGQTISDDDEWRGLGDEAPDWFTSETVNGEETRSVRVMNYFHTERKPITLVQLQDGSCVPEEAVPPDAPVALDEDGKPITRIDVQKSIKWAKIDGAQVLEETDWPSPYIPIVKVVGEELQPYDKERRYQGMVRPARDSQFGFDVMATTEVEVALMLPKTPIIGYAGQFEGFEAAWDQANVRNIGRLEANPYTANYTPMQGSPLPLPSALQRTADVGTFDGLRNMFDQAIRSTTGTPDSTLGNVDPGVRSGRAVKALIESAKQGTSGYLANLVKSVTYEAKIVNSLLYPIYGTRPGRLLQMMTGKHTTESVLVGQPFVQDAKQRPQPFDPTIHQGQEPKKFQLSKDAEFNVAIRVSKDWDTQRQEQVSVLGELIGAAPELMTWFGDLYFENQDGPGHKELAKRAKLMLAPPIQQSLAQQSQTAIPPEVQAMIGQLQQQLQQATQVIQTEQVKQQGQIQSAQIDAQAKAQASQADLDVKMRMAQMDADIQLRKAAMDNETKIRIEEMKLRGLAMQAEVDASEAALNRASGAQMQQVEQGHDAQQSSADRQMQAQAADADRGHQAELAKMGHEQALEQAQQAAALQPSSPLGGGA